MAKPTLLLDAHLKALRLPTFLREYDKVARHCAQEGLDCSRVPPLRAGVARSRTTRRRAAHQGRHPVLKSLETFEFRAIPSVNKRLVLELARSEYHRRENVLALGNSGTGKTHLVALYARVLGQWFDGIRFYAAASSPTRSRRTWAGLR